MSKNTQSSLSHFNVYFILLILKLILLLWNLVICIGHPKLLCEITKEIFLWKPHDIKKYLEVAAMMKIWWNILRYGKGGTQKQGPRKNGPLEKTSPEKWYPGKKSPAKWSPGKTVPGKNTLEKWLPEKWSPQKWSLEKWSPEKCPQKIVLRQKNDREFERLLHFYRLIPIHTERCSTFTSRSYVHQTVKD